MDETGFCAGCGRTYEIITFNPNKPLLLTDRDNREYITLVESINNRRKTILPVLIVCSVLILEK